MNNKIKQLFKNKTPASWKKILKNNVDILNYVQDIKNDINICTKLNDVIYLIINDISLTDLPKCLKCNKSLSMNQIRSGIRCCSVYCANSCNEKRDKLVETNKTHTKQYIEDIVKRRKQTLVNRYGIEHALHSVEIKERMKNKELLLHGVEHHTKRSNYKQKFEKLTYERFKRFSKYVVPVFTFEEFNNMGGNPYDIEFKWKCCKCCDEFYSKITCHKGYIPRCPKCYPSSISKTEFEIIDFLKKYHLNVKKSDRTIIKPLELDIVIPDKKVAIEYNGNYWHSELEQKNNYIHLYKTNKCTEQGYRLIHIFEDEWCNKKKIVQNRLKACLNLIKYKIYARKCVVKFLSIDDKRSFLNKYHIQGDCVDSIRLGLFYKNRLVAVMTFGSPRFSHKQNQIELIRYCTIANFKVIGGAGKLLSYFKTNLTSFNCVISYADKRWSTGNLYKKLGFTLVRESGPNYWYINTKDFMTRLSRLEFQKHKLKNKLINFDENLTEVQNMTNNGYTRIFDCGNYVFELKI